MDLHKRKKLLFFDGKNILHTYYMNNIKQKKRKNRYYFINNYKFTDTNNIYKSCIFKIQKEKCNLKAKNLMLFYIFKYLIILILLKPFSNLTIDLIVKATNGYKQILYTYNIRNPKKIDYNSWYGSHEYDEDYLKFNCQYPPCEVILSWDEETDEDDNQSTNNITVEENQEPEQDSSPVASPENPVASPDSPVASAESLASGQNSNSGQSSSSGNARLWQESISVIGENLFKDCQKITSIRFSTDFYFLSIPHMFDSCYSLVTIENLNIKNLENLESAFFNCYNLKEIIFEECSLSSQNIKASFMFANCVSLETINLNKCGEIKLSDMNSMFYNCQNLITLNMDTFETSEVMDMEKLFAGCTKLESLGLYNFNTQNATNMKQMFYNCHNLLNLDLSSFETTNVENMADMFYNCEKLTSLDFSVFSFNKVENMENIFYNCENLKIYNLNAQVEKVVNMSSMFYNCKALERLNLIKFNTKNVVDMKMLFYNCYSLITLQISNFDTQYVTNMNSMFYNCSKLASINLPTSFKTSKVEDMSSLYLY